MEIRDNTEFRNRLIALGEVFDAKLSPARVALYFEALRDLPFEQVAAALNRAVQLCKFFPRPAELRELVLGSGEDRAEAAWLSFRQAMGRVGAYCSLVTTDPALGETIQAMFGSWPSACALELSPEMWSSKRKEFGRVYAVMAARALHGQRYLLGLTEAANSGHPEYAKYFDVGVVNGGELRMLRGDEAECYREALAAGATVGMQQIGASMAQLVSRHEEAQ